MCRWKVKFENEALAQEALKQAPEWSDDTKELGLYVCRACGFLHIGHAPKWVPSKGTMPDPVLCEENISKNVMTLQDLTPL